MVVINTVGTSLLTNWKDLGSSFDESHQTHLMAALRGLAETARRLGAELTSIRSLTAQGVVKSGDRLVFLVSHQGLATLSALGTLYHEGFQDRFRAQAERPAPKPSGRSPEDKKIIYEDQNPGKHKGLADWLERLRHAPYVTRMQTFYHNPRLPGRSTVEPDPSHSGRVIAVYAAHGATTKAYVFLTENDPMKAQAAAADLAGRCAG